MKITTRLSLRSLILAAVITLTAGAMTSCRDRRIVKDGADASAANDSVSGESSGVDYPWPYAIMPLPAVPEPGAPFRIVAAGDINIRKARIIIRSVSGDTEPISLHGDGEAPAWLIGSFPALPAGDYRAVLMVNRKELCTADFCIAERKMARSQGVVWKTVRGWDSATETLYSAWMAALFHGNDEQSSWTSLHEVTQDRDHNFLYNYLSLGEDDATSKNKVVMQPDCADNPFFLRAYFSWKLGLPFGYHVCDRGYLGRNPSTGQWVTNQSSSSKNDPVQAFNLFLRRIMDGVHSGTARTSLDNEQADYYPVPLVRSALRPGTVYADPYGHTLILVNWQPQKKKSPGLLLAVDAQPDGTVAIKRFWKGNFLFNTTDVVGEPGFKAFRPIAFDGGSMSQIKNEALTATAGFVPYSLVQRKMETETFYHTMERLINPEPLDPEAQLTDLIQALHEQLLVRVNSVANAEAYFKSHPGTVIPMPSKAAAIFQSGGQWENFSTPNRDLRLLIAMDAVLDFPRRVAETPADYNVSGLGSPEKITEKLQSLLDRKVSELTVTYYRTDGSEQRLTVGEILNRREAFEVAYNPNDGAEIRWGAPEGSEERSTCRRQAPANQRQTMASVRKWFSKRLHPPT